MPGKIRATGTGSGLTNPTASVPNPAPKTVRKNHLVTSCGTAAATTGILIAFSEGLQPRLRRHGNVPGKRLGLTDTHHPMSDAYLSYPTRSKVRTARSVG